MAGRRAGAARERLLTAALELFARHGVSGTSLQMIADELGVTKAAVYHQFPSKQDIVLAVVEPARRQLELVADNAEALSTRTGRRDAALAGLVDLIVSNRRLAAVLHRDPVIAQVVRSGRAVRTYDERIAELLVGPEPDAELLVSFSMISGGLAVAAVDARLADIDDGALRELLLATARRILRIRPVRTAGDNAVTSAGTGDRGAAA
jgi:AcrR family transcriptional regulator